MSVRLRLTFRLKWFLTYTGHERNRVRQRRQLPGSLPHIQKGRTYTEGAEWLQHKLWDTTSLRNQVYTEASAVLHSADLSCPHQNFIRILARETGRWMGNGTEAVPHSLPSSCLLGTSQGGRPRLRWAVVQLLPTGAMCQNTYSTHHTDQVEGLRKV